MARAFLAVLLAFLPSAAMAQGATWLCAPATRLLCTREGCAAAAPDITELSFAPVEGRLAFCRSAACYQGIAELDREGAPDWRTLGIALVEELPLPHASMGAYRGRALFASFEVNDRRFVLSDLGGGGQDTTWFDCRPAG